jgi:hypothetical protein
MKWKLQVAYDRLGPRALDTQECRLTELLYLKEACFPSRNLYIYIQLVDGHEKLLLIQSPLHSICSLLNCTVVLVSFVMQQG